MKTVIFGVRLIYPYKNAEKVHRRKLHFKEVEWMFECLDAYHKDYPISEVVSGRAQGVDRYGEFWAEKRGIPVKPFPYLSEFGKAGGHIRNEQMAVYADRGIGFWDGFSNGTRNMIDNLEKLEKPCTIWRLKYEDYQEG